MQKFSIILAKKPKPETEASPSGEVQTADKPHGASSGKFSPAFSKRRRPSKARSLGRRRNGEISLRHLLFAKLLSFLAETRTPCLQGAFAAKCHRLSLSSRRIFCACAVKEKADYRLSICNSLLNVHFVINPGFPLGGRLNLAPHLPNVRHDGCKFLGCQ